MRILIGSITAIVMAVGTIGWLYLDSRIAGAVERSAARALGVEVRTGRVVPAWDGGPAFDIRSIRVANPDGFSDEPLLRIATVRVVPVGLWPSGDLAAVRLRQITLGLEYRRQRINLVRLLEHIDGYYTQGRTSEPTEFRIAHFDWQDLRLVTRLGPQYGRSGLLDLALADAVVEPDAEPLPVGLWIARLSDGLVRHSAHESRAHLPDEFAGKFAAGLGSRERALAPE